MVFVGYLRRFRFVEVDGGWMLLRQHGPGCGVICRIGYISSIRGGVGSRTRNGKRLGTGGCDDGWCNW